MKRYLVFAGYNYYPSGGWRDFVGKYDTREEAIQHAFEEKTDWCHVVNVETGEIVIKRYERSWRDGHN